MQVAMVLIFFAVIILLGFIPGIGRRSKRENAYYVVGILFSLTALLLKCGG